ncbi:hypothetical protein Hanom_Chr05g00407651 [Helianthus anomalus]
MADQGIPFPPIDAHSHFGTVEDTSHVENLSNDEYTEGEGTNVGAFRESGIRTTQTVTPTSHGTGPSTPAPSGIYALLGLPEGETLASWYAKSQATLNLIYSPLSAQQPLIKAQTYPSPSVTPAPRQVNYEMPP